MLPDKFASHATYQVNEFQIETQRNFLKHPEIPRTTPDESGRAPPATAAA